MDAFSTNRQCACSRAALQQVREWSIWGLPKDDVSIDNGILVTRGRRWPLMIDPQSQAYGWIKGMEGRSGLRSLRSTSQQLLRILEEALRAGQPLILEVGETLDPALQPLLLKQVLSTSLLGACTAVQIGGCMACGFHVPRFFFPLLTGVHLAISVSEFLDSAKHT